MKVFLESCYDLIGKLELPGVIVNRSVSNSVDSMSIDEVLKNKNLIVFEVDGQKKIYDVSKWFPIHLREKYYERNQSGQIL